MRARTIEEFVAGFPRAGGFVYVLTNEAHPHLHKIGFTTRSPAERAAELDTTGNPHPFVVAFALYHAEPRGAEHRLHVALEAQRVRSEREFFASPLADAVAIIMREFGEDADYFDLHAVTPAGKARLVQMQKKAESLKAVQGLAAAITERSMVQARLTAARAKLARRKSGLFRFLDNEAAEREVRDLEKRMEEMDARFMVMQKVVGGHNVIDDRMLKAGERLTAAIKERAALEYRHRVAWTVALLDLCHLA